MSDGAPEGEGAPRRRAQGPRETEVVVTVPRWLFRSWVPIAAAALCCSFGIGYWARGPAPEPSSPERITRVLFPVEEEPSPEALPPAATSSTVPLARATAEDTPTKPKAESRAPAAKTSAPKEPELSEAPPPPGSFGIQVGAYPSEAEAISFIAENREVLAELPVFVLPVEIKGRGVWHRVRVGVLDQREQTERLKDLLKAKLGESCLVVAYK